MRIATIGGQDNSPGSMSVFDDLVEEVCRFGISELHCVAAVMGVMGFTESSQADFKAIRACQRHDQVQRSKQNNVSVEV